MGSNDENYSTKVMKTPPEEVAQRVIRKAKRRGAILGWTTIALWVLVAAGVALGVHGYFTYIWPKWVEMTAYEADEAMPPAAVSEFAGITADLFVTYAYIWSGLVALAAASTLLYIRSSQRAKLAHIQVSLGHISSELERLARSEPRV